MLLNSDSRYGAITRTLHWSIALLILGLVALGWYMVDLTYYDKWYNASLSYHKAIGMLVLALGAAKILWKLVTSSPAHAPTIKPWELAGARIAHLLLYAMMIVIPVSGYLISTSAGDAVSFFGWFDIPALYPAGEELRDLAIDVHYYLAYATLALVGVHALAALKHQFVDKDGTLRKML